MPKLRVAMRREEKKEKKCNNRVIRRVRTRNIKFSPSICLPTIFFHLPSFACKADYAEFYNNFQTTRIEREQARARARAR